MAKITACLQLILFLCASATSKGHAPPNVVFILADDLGWDDVGFHGSEIKTPNIDRLAREGVILDNYYVQPLCTPTRGAVLTGRYPIHTGLQHYVIAGSQPYGLPLNETTLAQHLKTLGYTTHAVGKSRVFQKLHFTFWRPLYEDKCSYMEEWHLGFCSKGYLPENRGFDTHFGYYLGGSDFFDHYGHDGGYMGYDLHYNGQTVWNQSEVYSTEIFAARANAIIRSHDKSKPLFLYLAHQAVHVGNEEDKIQAPQKYVSRFPYIKNLKRRMFAGVVSALDDSVGVVYEALQETGLLNNTFIIFSTDNGGPSNGYDNNAACNWPLRGTKNTLWQGGVRGVGVIHSALLPKKTNSTYNLMHVVDWLPTIYRLAGGNTSNLKNIDGVDQWNAILNLTEARDEVLLNIDPVWKQEALILGDFKIIFGDISGGKYDGWYPPPQVSQMSQSHSNNPDIDYGQDFLSWKGTVNCGPKPKNASENCQPEKAPCLFNIKNDPCEYNNLAPALPSLVTKLQERINFYRSTMIPPGNKSIDPKGNPQLHGGVWGPWL